MTEAFPQINAVFFPSYKMLKTRPAITLLLSGPVTLRPGLDVSLSFDE